MFCKYFFKICLCFSKTPREIPTIFWEDTLTKKKKSPKNKKTLYLRLSKTCQDGQYDE